MDDIRIGIVQQNIIWENSSANIDKLEPSIKSLSDQKAHLIILPEMFNTGFSMNVSKTGETMNGRSVQWMQHISKKYGVTLMGSLNIKENDQYYNRLYITRKNEDDVYYDKKHLFRNGNEDKSFSPGQKQLIFSNNNWKIKTAICYDLRFPVWLKNTYDNGKFAYDLLVVIANWPATRNYQWEQLLIARAIENQSYVVGVNRVGKDGRNIEYIGNSIIINPIGEIIYRAKEKKEDYGFIELDKNELLHYREKMNCGRDWDKFRFSS